MAGRSWSKRPPMVLPRHHAFLWSAPTSMALRPSSADDPSAFKFTLADMPIRPGRTTQRASKALINKDLRRQRDYNRYSGLGDDDADEPKFRLLQWNGNIGDLSIPTHVAEPEEVYEDGDPDDDPDFPGFGVEDADEHDGCACIPPACVVPEPLRLVGGWETIEESKTVRRNSSVTSPAPASKEVSFKRDVSTEHGLITGGEILAGPCSLVNASPQVGVLLGGVSGGQFETTGLVGLDSVPVKGAPTESIDDRGGCLSFAGGHSAQDIDGGRQAFLEKSRLFMVERIIGADKVALLRSLELLDEVGGRLPCLDRRRRGRSARSGYVG